MFITGSSMLVANDGELAKQARVLATQARAGALCYLHFTTGFNYRLSNIDANIGFGQLSPLRQSLAPSRPLQYSCRSPHGFAWRKHATESVWGQSTRSLTCLAIDPQGAGIARN